jgi:hypothetical protein
MPIFHTDDEYQLYLAAREAVFAWQILKVEILSTFDPVETGTKSC